MTTPPPIPALPPLVVPHAPRPAVLPIRPDERRALAIRFDEAGRWTHLVGVRHGRAPGGRLS
ncbi:MAG: hypothetical protein MUF40_06645 [Gemmatimonadaceae bacterium]|nr:hypothetical protein [Gemmatimonadaceae bacterium]